MGADGPPHGLADMAREVPQQAGLGGRGDIPGPETVWTCLKEALGDCKPLVQGLEAAAVRVGNGRPMSGL